MELKLAIFPSKAKFLGLALMILALPFGYLYFFGGKPEIFNIKVFAIITAYMETRYFVISQTNALDELAAMLFIIGITLVSFSKERVEKDHYELLRIKALVNALYITIIIWLLSFLFIYGVAIIIVSFLIFIIFLLLYNILFRYYLTKQRRRNISTNTANKELVDV